MIPEQTPLLTTYCHSFPLCTRSEPLECVAVFVFERQSLFSLSFVFPDHFHLLYCFFFLCKSCSTGTEALRAVDYEALTGCVQ